MNKGYSEHATGFSSGEERATAPHHEEPITTEEQLAQSIADDIVAKMGIEKRAYITRHDVKEAALLAAQRAIEYASVDAPAKMIRIVYEMGEEA